MNNRVPVVTESKAGTSLVSYSFPSELLSSLKGLFPPARPYDFLIHSSATQTSTGGGIVNGAYTWNPSTSSFAEWTALAALFDEVVLVSAQMTWTTAFGPTSSGIVAQVSVAPDFVSDATPPSGFTAVTRLAGSSEFNISTGLGSGGSTTIRFSTKLPRDRPYAATSTPSPPVTSGPPAGCRGQWSWASNIVTTPSINYAFQVLRNHVRLRMRA
jgi:hypothetical protein